jgi:mannose-6-phosphate isomerase
MPQSNLRLEILGTAISITVDEDPEYLRQLLAEYNVKLEAIKQSTGLIDPLKIAILTGYSLCDELRRAREESQPEKDETLRRTLNLITRLDETITKDPFSCVQELYLLKNPVKHYPWGSPRWIPELLDIDNTGGEPWAELWMGAHPASPSALCIQGTEKSLGQFIAADPLRCLGKEWAAGGALPFLFKLLAASRPLSIQAHPGKEQARQGWLWENERGIPLDAPERNYRDDNHKPEIICALSPFTALCGFRPPVEIRILFSRFLAQAPSSLQSGLAPLQTVLANTGQGAFSVLRGFLKALFAIPPASMAELTDYALSVPPSPEAPGELWALIRSFAELYPEDPGILSPLYLNLLRLKPGEAVYLPTGILHAYVEGFGVELMANSDNVLRGGLSSKHIDVEELMKILYFHPFMPELLKPAAPSSRFSGVFSYPSPCKEFSLSVIDNLEGPFPLQGPVIIMITRGSLRAAGGEGKGWELGRGQSAFIPPGSRLNFWGDYTLYAASIPSPASEFRPVS